MALPSSENMMLTHAVIQSLLHRAYHQCHQTMLSPPIVYRQLIRYKSCFIMSQLLMHMTMLHQCESAPADLAHERLRLI